MASSFIYSFFPGDFKCMLKRVVNLQLINFAKKGIFSP